MLGEMSFALDEVMLLSGVSASETLVLKMIGQATMTPKP